MILCIYVYIYIYVYTIEFIVIVIVFITIHYVIQRECLQIFNTLNITKFKYGYRKYLPNWNIYMAQPIISPLGPGIDQPAF